MMVRRRLERFRRFLEAHDETPERLALAFSLGVFLTFTPLVGLHMILGVAVAFRFGLNRVALFSGMFVNNPWTLVPYYALATYLGGWLIGFPPSAPFPSLAWHHVLAGSFWHQLGMQWRLLLPMAIGSTILSILGAALAYPLALYAIRRGRSYLNSPPAPEMHP
jgi:uncharacterized protein